MKWVKNGAGNPDSMLTFAVIGVVAMVVSIFLSIFADTVIQISDKVSLHLQKPDITLVLALLGASTTAYVLRRNKTDEYEYNLKLAEVNKGVPINDEIDDEEEVKK